MFQKFGQPKQDNEQTDINKNCKTLASGLTASHTNKEPKKLKTNEIAMKKHILTF